MRLRVGGPVGLRVRVSVWLGVLVRLGVLRSRLLVGLCPGLGLALRLRLFLGFGTAASFGGTVWMGVDIALRTTVRLRMIAMLRLRVLAALAFDGRCAAHPRKKKG